MPELPEVETIARGLRPALEGRGIVSLDIRHAGSVRGGLDAKTLAATVPGRRILAVSRRAKLLLLTLSDDLILAFHLKMTGRLHLPAPDELPDRHTHLIFHLDNGGRLFFMDMRKFGYCAALTAGQLQAFPFYAALGPEPLETSPEDLAGRLKGRRGRIKALLLDQTVLAGVGNIYADEALFRAGLRPDAPADAVSASRKIGLMTHVRAVLQEGIDSCGASIRNYVDARGDAGAFQNTFNVYGRAGQPCPRCAASLEKMTVAGRTSTFCPRCQHG
ncbi:bifunctional DNA-formamidopyrimidine glycosylase/DNA-(apurinic or apyrimidinic site) lyase [Megalodesulfovibrio gigas]|uniref:Formamidopyrimidine-DNA glycosylase n=1 Tax=Megalodesulfovibrio gigas (strain ATCC 19364 / DSM 1382 / NCIMB 9332 / VKM B-1759) TaxID=1121448 RepID=T2GER5_MEGG1|nr:bifunctional DNA-formamidopyrimidine glycosylase/DNA-(apurinic or apyrimidinic site) lyase [Megalodesulfovibrio gigas]AGW14601.1 putative formamidopyrimidine-DNA glycosylase [Megalodesulfovibrio gigas DSM 1382 = ATCC 19364]